MDTLGHYITFLFAFCIMEDSNNSEVSIDPMDGVYVDVQLIVDATNSLDVNASMQDFENASTDEWIVEMESVFITSTPSALPTLMPSTLPSTLTPTATPSITGLVVTMNVTFSLRLFSEILQCV